MDNSALLAPAVTKLYLNRRDFVCKFICHLSFHKEGALRTSWDPEENVSTSHSFMTAVTD